MNSQIHHRARPATLALLAAAAPALASNPLAYLESNSSIDAGWSGGDPIGGYTSYSGHSEFHDGETNGVAVSLTGRMVASQALYLWSFPWTNSSGIDYNTTYSYNGDSYAGGPPDTSTRHFWISDTSDAVFRTFAPGILGRQWDPVLGQQLGQFSYCTIVSGTYSGGTFTPDGNILLDLTATTFPAASLPAGDYRFSASFQNEFDANAGFYIGTNMAWRMTFTPAPGAASLAAAGLLTALRRRR